MEPRDAAGEAARKLVDSCHCSQALEPNPCDGWLQQRKCDSLVQALAASTEAAVKGKDDVNLSLRFLLAQKDEAIEDLTARLAAAEAEREAWWTELTRINIERNAFRDERDALQHTLDLWDTECGGQSPRELKAAVEQARRGLQELIRRSQPLGGYDTFIAVREECQRLLAALTSPPGSQSPPLTMGTYEGWKGSD